MFPGRIGRAYAGPVLRGVCQMEFRRDPGDGARK